MAKRRKIAAPSAEDLSKIEEEFRRETLAKPSAGMAPISQVAAETARHQPVEGPDARIQRAHDAADAENFRRANAEGRVIQNVPLDHIQPDVIVRDRTVIDPDEMAELKASISAHGLRLPIEIFARREGRRSYALLSGFRRLQAYKELLDETQEERFRTIPALVRDPESLGGGFVAMVAENEIRASLSHFERGRIAVVAAQRGAFATTEAAVDALFATASKAKRSKIRSFSVIFEELGDMLGHAEGLKERDGLRLSSALKAGAGEALREALAAAAPATAAHEWAVLEPVVQAAEKGAAPSKAGRPKAKRQDELIADLALPGDVSLQAQAEGKGYVIRLKGRGVDAALVERAIQQLQNTFGQEEGK